MTITELETRANEAKKKRNHYADLYEFWSDRLKIAAESEVKEEAVDLQLIIDTVNDMASAFYDMAIDINNPTRERRTNRSRKFYCFYLRRNYPNLSLENIAKSIGLISHATIINAVHTHNDLMQTDVEYMKFGKYINTKLNGHIV